MAEGTFHRAVAAYEPFVLEKAGEEGSARAEALFARIGKMTGEASLDEAARTFAETWNEHGFCTDKDTANAATFKFWSASAKRIPPFLDEMRQAHDTQGPSLASPSELAKTKVPVLLLRGARTHALHRDSVRLVADHVAAPTVREIPGAGHYGTAQQGRRRSRRARAVLLRDAPVIKRSRAEAPRGTMRNVGRTGTSTAFHVKSAA